MWPLFFVIFAILVVLFMTRLSFRTQLRKISNLYGEMRSTFIYRSKVIQEVLDYVSKYNVKEKETMRIMDKMIERNTRSSDPAFIIGTECGMNIIMKNLLMNLDCYPVIREDEKYQKLKLKYYEIEKKSIEKASSYNKEVECFNHRVTCLPTNFVAELFHISLQPTYAIDEEMEEQIKVVF